MQLRDNICRWLSPSNVQDDLYRHRLEYLPGSCDWILRSPQIRQFLSRKTSTVARVQGRPGIGKTVLASFLVEYLEKQSKGCVLYFFCKAGDFEKRGATHIHRTLLAQLLRHDPSLYRYVESFYSRSGRATADSFVDVSKCLVLAFSNTLKPMISIVVDALDECEDVSNLLQVLFDARDSASAQLSMIFTSRHMQLPFSCDEDLILESQSSKRPIQEYIENRAQDFKSLCDVPLRMIVVRYVSRAADGLWLYARLMLDEIEKLPSIEIIKRHLQNIPQGLTQLYTQILQSKEARFTEIDLLFAQQIFLWLDVDDYLPPFISHDCLTYDTLSLILRKVNFGQPVFDPVTLLSDLCSPLVQAFDSQEDSSKPLTRDYGIISTHHTADQYICKSQNLPTSSLPAVLRPRRLRQLHRGVTAVWYFTSCEMSMQNLENYREAPYQGWHGAYFEMAYGLWAALRLTSLPEDLGVQESIEATTLLQQMVDFIDPNAQHCLRWVETAIITNYAAKCGQLLDNAIEGFEIGASHCLITTSKDFEAYHRARKVFFADYVYVLRMTGPEDCSNKDNPLPQGFEKRPLAVKILEIGTKWQYLHRSVEHCYHSQIAVNF